MRIGFSLNRDQQKILAAYLAVVVVILLWQIENHLARIAANQHRERDLRRRRDVEPVGVPDRDDVVDDEPELEDDQDGDDPEQKLRELAEDPDS